MSTLGDLLAEHGAAGCAVDHLQVGEWQPCRLVVCRPDVGLADGVLVCVAMPVNTGPMVDAGRHRRRATHAAGRRDSAAWDGAVGQQNSCQHDGHSVEVSPVRFGDQVVAVLTRHQPELAARRGDPATWSDRLSVVRHRSSPDAGGGHLPDDVA